MPRTSDTDGALFEQLRPRLQAISCRIVGSEADAEDIVQDCFLKWHGTEQAALATPAAWLTTVVQHQSIDRLRKRARDAAAYAAMELPPMASPALLEDDLLQRAEIGEALASLLTLLSPSERVALVLHEVFDCEHADIAAALGTNTVNARQHLARARRRLRENDAAGSSGETLSRELIDRFQTAIDDMDVLAMVALLNEQQLASVRKSSRLRITARACANDASYDIVMAA